MNYRDINEYNKIALPWEMDRSFTDLWGRIIQNCPYSNLEVMA